MQFGRLVISSERGEAVLDDQPMSLGGRGFEILSLLVRARGAVVTQEEIFQHVWPGRVVETNTLQAQISGLRKALGARRDLIQTVSGRGYRIRDDTAIREAPTAPPDAVPGLVGRTDPAARSNLRAMVSDIIGRDAALEEVTTLARSHRILTITGTGGIGKTRLALEVAREMAPEFADGVRLAELAPIADEGRILDAIATAVGLPAARDARSPAELAQALQGRHILLVLDNCEHVIGTAAAIAEAIAQASPQLRVLATSREMLGVEGERVFGLPPLDVPPERVTDPAIVLATGAARLFVAHANAASVDIATDAEAVRHIATICRRLDGIPLALEFAAARAATLGLKYTADGLDDLFTLLSRGRRTALPRHQTLRATLDWSFALLDPVEQVCLRRLAVFVGGFTMEAAMAVIADAAIPTNLVVASIGNLVAKSLVAIDGSDIGPRWRLLETTRAYARERLRDSDDGQATAHRHAAYYLTACRASTARTRGPSALPSLAVYRRDIANIRAALDWSFSPDGDAATGVMLTAAAVPMWCQLSLLVECRERVERALHGVGATPLDPRLQLELTAALGFAMTNSTGLLQETYAVLDAALALARDLGDADFQLRMLWSIWTCRFNNGETRAARGIADAFIALAGRTGNTADRLVGQRLLAVTLHYSGDQDGARRNLERMLQDYSAAYRDPHRLRFQFDQPVLARAVLARVLWLQGFADQALRVAETTIAEARAGGHALSLCYALAEGACAVALLTQKTAAAERYVGMLLEVAEQHDLAFWASWGRCLDGELRVLRGETEAGALALGQALDAFRAGGWATRLPEFLGAYGNALGLAGQFDAGVAAIDAALAQAENEGERWCAAELMRSKGDLILRAERHNALQTAEALFIASRDLAARQGALALELRAAISLARLGRMRGDDAYLAPLSHIYGRFTEGFESADLQAAKVLLIGYGGGMPQ